MAVVGRSSGAIQGRSSHDDSSAVNLSSALNNFNTSAQEFVNAIHELTGHSSQKDPVGKLSKVLDKNQKANQSHVKNLSKVGDATVKSLGVVIKTALKEFTKAADSVIDSYKSNLSNITVRMDLSNSQYSRLFNEASAYFQRNKLNKQFSPTDYANALSESLEVGLRGDQARQLSYQNLITKKLIPAINTNSKYYVQMQRQLGSSFDKYIVAMTKNSEETLGYSGAEEGKLLSLIQSIGTDLRAVSSDDTAINQALGKFYQMTSVLGKYGIDQEDFLSQLQQTLTSPGSPNLFMANAGITSPDNLVDLVNNPQKLDQFFESYIKSATQEKNYNAALAYAEQLGMSPETAKQFKALGIREGQTEQLLADYYASELDNADADKIYQDYMKKLQQGFYQTADASLDNIEKNLATGYATVSASIPRMDTIINVLVSIASIISSSLLKGTLTGGSGGLGLKGLMTNGTGAKGWGGLSAAGKIVGVGSILAGTAIAGYDAYQNFSNTQGSLLSKLGAGAEGFITGRTEGTMSAEEKLARVKEKGMIDWGQVGKNAGKGALIGAGVGTLAGGHTLLGGVIGGAAGAVASLVDQTVRYADTVKYLKSDMGQLSDRISKTDTELGQITTDYQSYGALLTDYNALQEELNNTTKEDERAALQTRIDLMNAEIEIMKASLPSAEYVGALMQSYTDDLKSSESMALLGGNLSKYFTKDAYAQLKGKDISKMNINDLSEILGMSQDEMDKIGQLAISAGFIKEGTDFRDAFKATLIDYGSANNYLKTNVKGSDMDEVKVGGKSAYFALTKDNLRGFVETTQTARSNLSDQSAKGLSTLKSFSNISGISNDEIQTPLTQALWNDYQRGSLPSEGVSKYLQGLGYSESVANSYAAYANDHYNYVKGWFKTGINYVPEDEYPSILHKGEMVLTASNASTLRSIMSQGGISGLLNGILGLTEAKTSATVTEDSSVEFTTPIVRSIENQTSIISTLLSEILDKLNGSPAPQSNRNYTSLINYHQAGGTLA